MLDECSQGSFIDAEMLNSLSVQCRGTEIIAETINGAESVETEAVNGMVVISSQNQVVYSEIEINLPITYSGSK